MNADLATVSDIHFRFLELLPTRQQVPGVFSALACSIITASPFVSNAE